MHYIPDPLLYPQERGFTSGTTTKVDSTGSTPTKSSHMVGIGRAGSSFGGVSKKAKGSGGVAISEEVRETAAAVAADSSETVWYVCLCVSRFLFRAHVVHVARNF